MTRIYQEFDICTATPRQERLILNFTKNYSRTFSKKVKVTKEYLNYIRTSSMVKKYHFKP